MEKQEKWTVGLLSHGLESKEKLFDSKKAAIDYGKIHFEELFEKEFNEKFNAETHDREFFIGQIELFTPRIFAGDVFQNIEENAFENVGPHAENYLGNVKSEDAVLLEKKLNEVLYDWLNVTNNHASFGRVKHVELIHA